MCLCHASTFAQSAWLVSFRCLSSWKQCPRVLLCALASGAFFHMALRHAATVIAATPATLVKGVTPATALGTDSPSYLHRLCALRNTVHIAVSMELHARTVSVATAAGRIGRIRITVLDMHPRLSLLVHAARMQDGAVLTNTEKVGTAPVTGGPVRKLSGAALTSAEMVGTTQANGGPARLQAGAPLTKHEKGGTALAIGGPARLQAGAVLTNQEKIGTPLAIRGVTTAAFVRFGFALV